MSDSERFLFGTREHGRSVKGYPEDPRREMRKASRFRVLEHLRKIPDIRRDKVRAARRSMVSGEWKSGGRKVAEKILYEHLFDSTVR